MISPSSTRLIHTTDLYDKQSQRTEQSIDTVVQSLYINKVNPIKPRTVYRANEHINIKPNLYTSRPHSTSHYHHTIKKYSAVDECKINHEHNIVVNEADNHSVRSIVNQHHINKHATVELRSQLHTNHIKYNLSYNQQLQSIYHCNQLNKQYYNNRRSQPAHVHTIQSSGLTDDTLQNPLYIWSIQSDVPLKRPITSVDKRRPATSASINRRTTSANNKKPAKPIIKVNPLIDTTPVIDPIDTVLNTIRPITANYTALNNPIQQHAINNNTPTVYTRPISATHTTNLLLHKLQSSDIQCQSNNIHNLLNSIELQSSQHNDNTAINSANTVRPMSAPMRLPRHPFAGTSRVSSAKVKKKKKKKVAK